MRTFFLDTTLRAGFAAVRLGASLPDWHFTQKFAQWTALKQLLTRLRINCFLDVGANRGLFAKHVRMTGFEGHIFSFEPNPEDFRRMSDLAGADPRWRAFNVALGSEDARRPFHIAKRSVYSSFLDPRTVEVDRTEEVQVRRLDGMLEELLAPISEPRVFLKMDTQGYDLEVVAGAKGCIETILGLQSELSVTPIYAHMPHYLDALAAYERLGFSLMDLFLVNRTSCGSIMEYDCLMARTGSLDGGPAADATR